MPTRASSCPCRSRAQSRSSRRVRRCARAHAHSLTRAERNETMRLLRICCATGSARPYGNAVLAVAHSCSQRKRHQSTRWRPLPLRWRWRRRRRWRRSARPALCQRSRSSARCPPNCSRRRARARRTRSGITAPGACIASPNDHHHVHTMKHTQTAAVQTGLHARRTSACVHTSTSFEMHAACHATCHLA